MSEGRKFDASKARVELLPFVALEEIAAVMTFGAKKYGDDNWASGLAWRRLLGATLRHLYAFARGEDLDPESGLSHLAHAGCSVMFLLWHARFRRDLDNRLIDPDQKEASNVTTGDPLVLFGNTPPRAGGGTP